MKNKVSVSVLSADFLTLGSEIEKIERSGADMLHFDVMDGIFVNNISFGFPILEIVNKKTDMPIDVHLMIEDPCRYAKRCAELGADMISFHLESGSDTLKTINAVKEAGAEAGLALRPGTPFEMAMPFMDKIDMLLIMTVEPGFGGQSFMHGMLEKISDARKYIDANGLDVSIQVDGGINSETAKYASNAGADIMVAGNYIFKSSDMKKAVRLLSEC